MDILLLLQCGIYTEFIISIPSIRPKRAYLRKKNVNKLQSTSTSTPIIRVIPTENYSTSKPQSKLLIWRL